LQRDGTPGEHWHGRTLFQAIGRAIDKQCRLSDRVLALFEQDAIGLDAQDAAKPDDIADALQLLIFGHRQGGAAVHCRAHHRIEPDQSPARLKPVE